MCVCVCACVCVCVSPWAASPVQAWDALPTIIASIQPLPPRFPLSLSLDHTTITHHVTHSVWHGTTLTQAHTYKITPHSALPAHGVGMDPSLPLCVCVAPGLLTLDSSTDEHDNARSTDNTHNPPTHPPTLANTHTRMRTHRERDTHTHTHAVPARVGMMNSSFPVATF